MAQNIQQVRGTKDLLPQDNLAFRFIDHHAWSCAKKYGFQELNTPTFEFTEVFSRTLGDTSDVVTKEMYTFSDRGGDSLTLRPEGTAGIARAIVSNGLIQNIPLRFYYVGAMFRYERPQKGRYRQFHQIGAEIIGPASPIADIEAIALGYDILNSIGLNKRYKLEINTLGDKESRQNYLQALKDYLKNFESELSADSKTRLEKNPLRILDSKDESDKKILQNAPKLSEHLNEASKDFFKKVTSGLETLGIPYSLNNRLVRGLDYYCHTVFEFTTDELGAQGAILAGGRYEGLIEYMGGPATPCVGWAAGLERLSLLLNPELITKKDVVVALIAAEDKAESTCLKITHDLRQAGFTVEMPLSGNMGKKMKRADKVGADYAVIIGSQELTNKAVSLKNLKTGEQKEVSQASLISELKK